MNLSKLLTTIGLLAVALAQQLSTDHRELTVGLSIVFFLIALVFVYRSFYGMRIRAHGGGQSQSPATPAKQMVGAK